MGRCEMRADPDELHIQCQAANQSELEEVADTIKSHFERFAQRQGLVLKWM